MRRLAPRRGGSILLAALALLVAAGQARAQIDFTPSVTFVNGLYTYDYTVANNSAEDLALINLNVTPGDQTAFNLSVPTGFQGVYDSGLGIVTFLSDAEVFGAGTALGGFRFDSIYAPSATTFDALSVNGTAFNGATQGPVVPEPGSVTLLTGLGVIGLLACRRRRK
jgi:hypothetical protein